MAEASWDMAWEKHVSERQEELFSQKQQESHYRVTAEGGYESGRIDVRHRAEREVLSEMLDRLDSLEVQK